MCKECKEQFIANGNRMFYNSFDELTDDLKNKFKSETTRLNNYNKSKKAYVDFINKLNIKGDKLLSDYINNSTKVRIHYGRCGHTHPKGEGVTPTNYKNERGCGICRGNIIIKGINNLATTHPQYVKYFVNIEDVYTHTYASHDEVEMKCPECGTIKVMRIDTLIRKGFGCSKCSDGISYPEKVLALLLDCLNIKFKKQLKFNSYKYLYDFYLIDYNIIIEVHGEQHYKNNSWKSYKEEHENDLIKYDIAVLNDYEYNKNYFVIDARESNIEWLRNSINNCLFFQQFDLNNIDWKEIDKQAQKSKKVEVCLYWKEQKEINKDLTTIIMAEIFGVNNSTIYEWLNWGSENGLCIYSGKEERKADLRRRSKFVYLIKQDGTKWHDKPMSQGELARLTGINKSTIARCKKDNKPLSNKRPHNTQYNPKYIGSYIVEEDKLEEFLLNLK